MCRRVLIYLFCCFPLFAFAQNNGNRVNVVSSKLTKDTISIGDQIEWSTIFNVHKNSKLAILPYVEVLKAANAAVSMDTTAGARPVEAKIEVIKDFVIDTISTKDAIDRLEVKVILTSFDSGSYKLPMPLIIIAGSPTLSNSGNPNVAMDTLKFNTPVLNVTTMQIDTSKFQVYDIKGQIKYPLTFGEVFPWILLVIAFVAIVYIVLRYIKYRRENKDFFGNTIIKEPPHIIALRELEKIRNQKLWQSGKQKQYYTGITDTLREYIEKRYSVSAMEKTSSEILSELTDKKIEKRVYDELDDLFKLSDLVKFAKYIPIEAENEEAIPKAVTFINSTFMQEVVEENNEKKEVK